MAHSHLKFLVPALWSKPSSDSEKTTDKTMDNAEAKDMNKADLKDKNLSNKVYLTQIMAKQ